MEEKVMNLNEEIKNEDTTDEEITEETTEETVDATEETEDDIMVAFGTVVGCKNLNIRKRPVVNNSNVLCVVPAGTPLMVIDPEKATKEWYKVELENGDTGFCMKEFVSVNE